MARSLTLTNPRPGGVMSAFCEPATTTSIPHSSVLNVQAPRPETASTMVTTSEAALAKPSMSLTVPVEVSESTQIAALISGSLASASATSSLSAFWPHSYVSSVTSRPKVRLILTHRPPKLPLFTTRTLSPAEKRFCIAPSKAPVPLAAKVKISFSVKKTRFKFSFTLVNTSPNSGVRWWMIGSAPAAETSGGIGVGPGDIRRYLFIMGAELPLSPRTTGSYSRHNRCRWLHNGTSLLQSVAFGIATVAAADRCPLVTRGPPASALGGRVGDGPDTHASVDSLHRGDHRGSPVSEPDYSE